MKRLILCLWPILALLATPLSAQVSGPTIQQIGGDAPAVSVMQRKQAASTAVFPMNSDIHIMLAKNWTDPGVGQVCTWVDQYSTIQATESTDAYKPIKASVGGYDCIVFPALSKHWMEFSKWTNTTNLASYTIIVDVVANKYDYGYFWISFSNTADTAYESGRLFSSNTKWSFESPQLTNPAAQPTTHDLSSPPASGTEFFHWWRKDNTGAGSCTQTLEYWPSTTCVQVNAPEPAASGVNRAHISLTNNPLNIRAWAYATRKLSDAEIAQTIAYMGNNR